ncbi:MAG: hypothetical protein CMK46_06605 [Porticoccus sp.]|nr:hypothetical protein [Porticoccus sp.]
MNSKKETQMQSTNIPRRYAGLPIFEVLCERPNPTSPGFVLVIFWCKHCKRLHQHGSRRIHHEEFMARGAHCGVSASERGFKNYQLHRVPWTRVHTEDGVTAPVLEVVGRQKNGKALVICPTCLKKHRVDLSKRAEYTLAECKCFPRYFAHQDVV